MNKNEHKITKALYWLLFYVFLKPYIFFTYHYHAKSKYKIKKNEPVLIFSNHQTDLDPLFIHYSFNKILRIVATDTIFQKGFISRQLEKLGVIAKRKGTVDIKCFMEIQKAIKNGDSVLIFLEGNRTYADFQFYISPKISRIVRNLNVPIILFNFHGGTGVNPRFASKRRRGPFYGEIKKIITPSEYNDLSDDELANIIISNLRVIDSESHHLYKSKRKAEYLERLFFLCPNCKSTSHLVSKKDVFYCEKCDFKVKFGEDLKLHNLDNDKENIKMLDWYNLQKKWVKDLKINEGDTIFCDHNIVLKKANPYQNRETLYQGKMSLTDKELIFGNIRFPLINIENASPISGTKLSFADHDNHYLVIGHSRFNPLKYVLMFNKLETNMKINNTDNYYRLDVEEK